MYVTNDGFPKAILPFKSYSFFKLEPGWHIIGLSNEHLNKVEFFEIFCRADETQVLNLMSYYKPRTFNPDLPSKLECHGFIFRRYFPKYINELVKEDKLDYVDLKPEGVDKIASHFAKAAKNLTYDKDTKLLIYENYSLPNEVPVYPQDGWTFQTKVGTTESGQFKLGMSKSSEVVFSKKGIKIQHPTDKDKNKFIPIENILSFDTHPGKKLKHQLQYLVVHYNEGNVDKNILFVDYDEIYRWDSMECRLTNLISEKRNIEKFKDIFKKNTDEVKKISDFHYAQVHTVDFVNYNQLTSITDVGLWFSHYIASFKNSHNN